MKDNEIINGLECCNHEYVWQKECFDCEYATFEANCGKEMIKDALDLINRQKAEIEKLKTDFQIEASNKLEKEIKAEAIKEFAERLKNHLRQQPKWCINRDHYRNVGFSYDDVFFGIDHILKEMTEGENG